MVLKEFVEKKLADVYARDSVGAQILTEQISQMIEIREIHKIKNP